MQLQQCLHTNKLSITTF